MKKTVDLKSKLKSLPKKPGVYLFRDKNRQIIYIGKALVLKNRVSSYFQQKHHDPKTQELVENIAEVEYVVVNSEFEALLLEARLIKQHEPKYNLAQKDSKSYLYIVISKEFPNRVFTARWTELNQPLSAWYGPFPSSADAKQILSTLRRIFPFRSCKTLPKSPCLYRHLGLCPGVCLSVEGYAVSIRRLNLILSGKTQNLIASLKKEMKSFAKATDFEKAQILKKQINALKSLTEGGWQSVPKEKQDRSRAILGLRQLLVKYQGSDPMVLNKIEGYDVANLGSEVIVGSQVVFIDGEPDSSLYRQFNLKFNQLFQDDPLGIKNILQRRLKHPEWIYPQLILIDGGKTQVNAAFSALKEKGLLGQISLLGLTKENETIIVPRIEKERLVGWRQLHLSRRSPELQLLQAIRDEAHRFAQRYYQHRHRHKLLAQ